MAKDPATPVTVTIPKSLKRISVNTAKALHMSLSAFVAARLRDYFQQIEKGMR